MATQVLVPVMGEAVGEARIGAWLKRAGDPVKRGDELAELETDKAVLMIECPADGVLLEILMEAGSMVSTGQVLARVGRVEEAQSEQPQGSREMAAPQPQAVDDKDEHPAAVAASRQNVAADSAAADSAAADWGRLRVSPAARRMARAHGLDLAPLAAAKGAGRVTSEDVARAVEKRRVAQRRLLLSANQRVMAARMTQSAQETPQFSVAIHVEAGPLLEVKQALTATGGRVSLTALLAHLLGRVILKHPLLNARFDGDAITIFETANIGVAVAAPGGLVVPVLHGVERMALGDVGRRLGELAAAARAGVLTPDEVSGGTFTLSNLGMYGVSAFVPLVNPPQSAILGVAAVEGVVVPSEGGTRHVQRMTLTLSADHRVVDGAYAAAFLQELRAVIEEAQIG